MKTFAQKSPYESPWSLRQRSAMVLWEYCWMLFCSWTPKPLNASRLGWLRLFGDRANAYSLGKIEIGEGATGAQEAYLYTGTHVSQIPPSRCKPRRSSSGRTPSSEPAPSSCPA